MLCGFKPGAIFRLRENMWGLNLQALKTFYLYCSKICIHQTWHGGDLLLGASTDKVTLSFDHVVVQDHMTN